MSKLQPDELLRYARKIAVVEPNAWEPADPRHPVINQLVEAGYLRRVHGRCGFEAFKESMVKWTEAGRVAVGIQNADGAQK